MNKPESEQKNPLRQTLVEQLPAEYQLESGEALDIFLNYISELGLTLYEAQEEAILEIFDGHNVILNTPTGSGKSLVATAMHFYAINAGRKSFYTCPIKALVNEKFLALCRDFGAENVGMITGDASVNPTAPIICCTAEILMNIALREGAEAEVDDVIMDEFHYYSDRDRGTAWQVPLLTLPHCRFLLMSATMGDATKFSDMLSRMTGKTCSIIRSGERPVPLDFEYRETPLDQTIQDLMSRGCAPVYLVHFTQRECAENAQACLSLNFCSKEEKTRISDEIRDAGFSSPYGKEVKKFLLHGIGIHHAGLLPKYRVLTEKLAQKGLLKIICGTDTLGVGINVPIRTVLFTQLCKFNGTKTALLSAREFHQISGRAGRKGFDQKGLVVAQAPSHVIENLKLERKAQLNPRLKKKMVKAKPPEKGFVMWNQDIFNRLIEAPPEALLSSFQISHGLLLNVLSRKQNGCESMRQLIRDSDESDAMKKRHRKRAFQLFRSLLDKQIIEIIPVGERDQTKVRVNLDLQEDFSLNQALSLYLLDTLNFLDPMSEDYVFRILTLTESIIENPALILHRQLDKIRRAALARLREQGAEYEERTALLEQLEYPKPHKEWIYETFNAYAGQHPWIGQENIRPKSIAREMFETYQSFGEYIREYGLERVEGLLLRYLSDVYKVLVQTVPHDLKNDATDDMIEYFRSIIRSTDSSLLDEWERLRNPAGSEGKFVPSSAVIQEEISHDIMADKKSLMTMIRNTLFHVLRALSVGHYERCLSLIYQEPDTPEEHLWTEEKLEQIMLHYHENHEQLLSGPEARNPAYTRTESEEDGEGMKISLIMTDPDQQNDWEMIFDLCPEASRQAGSLQMSLVRIGEIED
ncbi:MAG: DUF3516 domain-containing protein [Deltaproteobacteria bacterium]|nr:DUF3516 domain-containing protein [Deltaproteobacteria bacterium]